MSDERDALYERIRRTLPSEDAEALKQLLYPASSQHVSQTGQHNINTQSGTTIQHVGDRHYYGLTPEGIKAVFTKLVDSNVTLRATLSEEEANHSNQDIALPLLSAESALVEYLNSRLMTLDEISRSGHLPEHQQAEFNSIKVELSSFQEKNQELKLISSEIDRILRESIQSLSQKLQELSASQDESLLEARSQICIRDQIDILENFHKELQGGKVVSRWLTRERDSIRDSIVNHVLKTHPQIEATSSAHKMRMFVITIEQFIDRLDYCLQWGRLDGLRESVTPMVLESYAYIEALEKLKKELPNHLPEDGRSQLFEYVEYFQDSFKNDYTDNLMEDD